MINTALIGCGYWGKKLLGYLNDHKEFYVKHICDSKTDMNRVWNSVEAVVIATPIHTHYKIAKEALKRGKHVFVEKPIALKKEEAVDLKELANKKDRTLLTDFTWTFSEALKKAQQANIGEIKIVELSIRRPSRAGVVYSASWVLGTHALAILDMFIPLQELGFRCAAVYGNSGLITFHYRWNSPGLVGRISININQPKKETKLAIYGTEGKIVYEPESGSLKIRDKIYTFDEKNNLGLAVDYFYEALRGRVTSNIDRAILVTEVLENL